MKPNLLQRLRPVRDARERRALRQHHEASHAHQQTLGEQLNAQRGVARLQGALERARDQALAAGPVSAVQAQAALEYAQSLGEPLALARERAQACREAAERALAAARVTRQAHARQVLRNETLRKTCDSQAALARRTQHSADERRQEDEFLPQWTMHRCAGKPGGRP